MARLTAFLRHRWKLVVNILTMLALIVFVLAIRDQLGQTFSNLVRVHAWALLLIIPVEILNYDAQARLYRSLFRVVGSTVGYRAMFETSLELNFINTVFPSGGVTGISYFGMRMRGRDITGAKAAVVQMFKLVLLFLTFEIVLIFGLLFLAAAGQVNNLTILVAGSFTTIMIMGTAAFAFVIGSKRRIAGFFTYVTRLINRLIHLVRPGHPETINTERARVLFEDLNENYQLVKNDYRALKKPVLWALAANIWEVLAVYVVYLAFGHWVNLGAVILAYSVANFAGLLSVLPSGVGVYEALMTAVLVTAGVPAKLSLPVTIMYRVVNTLVQLPAGYYFYHRTLHTAKEPTRID